MYYYFSSKISNKLFGFTKGFSPQHALISLLEKFKRELGKNNNGWLLFNEMRPKITYHDVNEDKKFVSLCNYVSNTVNTEISDDDILLDRVNSKYYDIKKLNSTKIDIPSSFGLFHANIASLNLHIDDLKHISSLLNYKFDIIGISEHKIRKDSPPSNIIFIPGYNEFFYEPTETTHGSDGFYIKDNLDHILRKDLQINFLGNFESTFIEIQFPKKKNLIIGCIYRHPSSDISIQEFTNNHLDTILQKIGTENKQCILMRDFNVDLMKINSHNESNVFFNNLTNHYFTLEPTRLTSKTLIDNIFFNSLEYHSLRGNIVIEISDHLIQFLILQGYIKEGHIPATNLYKRDFKNFNEMKFEEVVLSMDWDNICSLEKNDPNFSCNNFFNSITYQLDEFAPFKKVTRKEYNLILNPWFTKGILVKCDKRDSILKKISKETDPVTRTSLHNDYKKLRNEITTDKRKSKKSYYFSYFEKNKQKSSEICKVGKVR